MLKMKMIILQREQGRKRWEKQKKVAVLLDYIVFVFVTLFAVVACVTRVVT